MSVFLIMVIGGSVLFIAFILLSYYLAKFEKEIEIARIKANQKEEKTKIKLSTVFTWIFLLSAFGIIWIPQYRTELIGTVFLSFILGYIESKGKGKKEKTE